ncbi:hypothetical protein B0H14DRAFT_3032050 [Mycena olivaceomarginata]|nr:hypothetical protein B0H14DRAFT_3032050 [Mycena olivaceomarginata]
MGSRVRCHPRRGNDRGYIQQKAKQRRIKDALGHRRLRRLVEQTVPLLPLEHVSAPLRNRPPARRLTSPRPLLSRSRHPYLRLGGSAQDGAAARCVTDAAESLVSGPWHVSDVSRHNDTERSSENYRRIQRHALLDLWRDLGCMSVKTCISASRHRLDVSRLAQVHLPAWRREPAPHRGRKGHLQACADCCLWRCLRRREAVVPATTLLLGQVNHPADDFLTGYDVFIILDALEVAWTRAGTTAGDVDLLSLFADNAARCTSYFLQCAL